MELDDRERLRAWSDVLDDATYYELLGVLEIADEDAVRRAFRQFSRAFHPDAHTGADEEIQVLLRRLFQRGAEAYRVLIDSELRARYDLELAKGQTRLGVRPAEAVNQVRSLDDLCRTASGKLHAQKADRAISDGDLAGARSFLLAAMRAEDEPDPELDARLDAIDLALFAKGV